MYFNRARYYNPQIGRFTSRDSVAGSNESPVTLNRYIYAQNDPTGLTDASGNKPDYCKNPINSWRPECRENNQCEINPATCLVPPLQPFSTSDKDNERKRCSASPDGKFYCFVEPQNNTQQGSTQEQDQSEANETQEESKTNFLKDLLRLLRLISKIQQDNKADGCPPGTFNCRRIYFTQVSASEVGRREDGTTYNVWDNINQLRNNPSAVNAFPGIRIFIKDPTMDSWGPKTQRIRDQEYSGDPRNLNNGEIYSLDNRRLFTFKMAGLKCVPVVWVDRNVIHELRWHIDTTSKGRTISVGGIPYTFL